MKRIIFSLALALSSLLCLGQSQGISYQAIIIDENPQQIPGLNIDGNILVNHPLMVRFTILDAVGTIDYQEEHATSTDAGGMINLTIGTGNPTAYSPYTFTEIDWDGTPKFLKVDISTSETETFYVDFSYQLLTFVPYAYHKNITATGTLRVDDKSILQDLTVEKSTNLEGNLSVNNASAASLTGTLSVTQATDLKGTLNVASASNFKGQVTIDADVNGNESSPNSYPLRVRGSNQGISISIDKSRENSTNFLVFMDTDGVQGRIEGESSSDITSDPLYYFENAKLIVETGVAGANLVAACTASTVCAGLGVCVTAPPPSKIIFGIAQVVVRTAQVIMYNVFRHTNAGVVYKSKGADYAEYLPKANPSEVFSPGDLVGVTGGYITKSTLEADRIMVVSRKPVVLGNMPSEGEEGAFEKVAFIGQVEVKVIGSVNVGDFILPSGNNDGVGVAVSPEAITFEQLLLVAGVAWSSSQANPYGYINLAVGLSSNDAARLSLKQEKRISEQEDEINHLKTQLDQINRALAILLPNYAEVAGISTLADDNSDTSCNAIPAQEAKTDAATSEAAFEPGELTLFYFTPTRDQVIAGVEMAKEILERESKGSTINPLFEKLDADPGYREVFIDELLSTINKEIDKNYNRDLGLGVKALKF